MNWKKQLKNQAGMSLIEILIVITLIGLTMTFVGGKVMEQLEEGRVEVAKTQIRMLEERLKEFRRHCGSYPTTDQGLLALTQKPTGGKECPRYRPGGYLEDDKVPLDPWDTDYTYQSDDSGKTYTIISLGGDKAEGGEGYDADISSKDL